MKYDKSLFKVIFTKGSGPGGQHKNKVETCCVITHIPTGLTQTCQDSRSKMTNFETALNRLQSKLKSMNDLARHEQLNSKRQEALTTVIRTYNFQRNEVKDHRTNKTAHLGRVLNGHLELIQQ